MPELSYSTHAEADLDEIHHYIAVIEVLRIIHTARNWLRVFRHG